MLIKKVRAHAYTRAYKDMLSYRVKPIVYYRHPPKKKFFFSNVVIEKKVFTFALVIYKRKG